MTAVSPSSSDNPQTPTALIASAVSPSQIELSWADNSEDETGFRVERRVNAIIDEVYDIGANSTRFRDLFLIPFTTYSYRVTE